MYSEQSIIDQINVRSDGQIEVRRADRVLRDGVTIAETYCRHVVSPLDDCKGQDPRVRAVAMAVHTPAVVAAYRKSLGDSL